MIKKEKKKQRTGPAKTQKKSGAKLEAVCNIQLSGFQDTCRRQYKYDSTTASKAYKFKRFRYMQGTS